MKATVKHYFDTHPENNECFETSDGFIFHAREMAKAHSFSLDDKNVKDHKRADTDSEFVSKEVVDLATASADSQKVRDAKDQETLHNVASGKEQQQAEDKVSKAADGDVKAAVDETKKDLPTGGADDKDQAGKNAGAVAGAAAAEAGANTVKTTVTTPVKKAAPKKAAGQ